MAMPRRDTEEFSSILTPEEGRALFDATARHMLGISGLEFLTNWDAGYYRDIDLDATEEGHRIGHLVLLMPFAR